MESNSSNLDNIENIVGSFVKNNSEKSIGNGVPVLDGHVSSLTSNLPFREGRDIFVNTPHVIVMVGLPARGKTYMAKKLTRYLNWIGIKTKVFNVGEYRRRATKHYNNHNFFRPDNESAMSVRQLCAKDALKDVCDWLENENGQVAVFDATNTTMERRWLIYNTVVKKMQYKLFYIESICDDPKIIESNIKEVKINSPDYQGVDTETALKDFLQRIEHYQKQYQPLDEEKEDHLSFMKIYNTGGKVVIHKQTGHLQSRIVYYFMNIHILRRTIYFTRHGESELNVAGRIGGDSSLSANGKAYNKALVKYINEQNIPKLRVWTSTMKRTIETAAGIVAPQERWKTLNEIDAGIFEEMTYEEIKSSRPEELSSRDKDKFSYRYPRGESYEDLVSRLEPVIMELERRENVLLVAHQAVLRCLLGYFLDIPSADLPHLEIPLHTIMKLVPVAYGCEVERIPLDVPAVNTHRPRQEVSRTPSPVGLNPDVDHSTTALEPGQMAPLKGLLDS